MMASVSSQSLSRRWLVAILLSGLVLRLLFVLVVDPSYSNFGGDTSWLMTIGHDLLTGTLTVSPATGPGYLVFDGFIQALVGADRSLQVIRVLNAFMGTALCGFLYVLGARYFTERVGLWAALMLAINPVFIIEAGNVLTESVFLSLLFGSFALYAARQDRLDWRVLGSVGVLLGLATLTRAVSILLPLVFVVHIVYIHRKAALQLVGALLVAYVVVVSVWSVYSVVRWNTFVIGAQGLAANLYLGTTTWCGPGCVDQQAGITQDSSNNQNVYVQGTFDAIRKDPVGYVRHRIENLLDAQLQPYNTVYFPGESIKALIVDWWSHGHSVSDLARISQADYFAQKLALYIFHFTALLGGFVGLLFGIRQFSARLPLYGILAYFLVLHTALTAIPRYLLPIEPLWILFAVYAAVTIVGLIQKGFTQTTVTDLAIKTPQPNL